jgi:outer membrane protein TolC
MRFPYLILLAGRRPPVLRGAGEWSGAWLGLAAMVAIAIAMRPAFAQGPKHGEGEAAARSAEPPGERVTIDALIAAAVQRSVGLTIAYADREEARGRGAAADAVDEWHLIARLDGQGTVVDRTRASSPAALDTRSAHAAVGVQRSLWTGGDITVTAAGGPVLGASPAAVSGARSVAGDPQVTEMTASARIDASQPLLRGAGEEVARADQKTARLAARALSAQAEDEAAGLVRDLVVGYWELTYAVQTLAIDRDSEALAQRQVATTQQVVRAGLQPPSAMKIAELHVALRQEAILRDQMTIADQSLAVRRLAGLELTSAPLVPGDPPEIPTTRWREDEAVSATLAHGPTITQKKLAQRAASVAVDVAQDGTLPRLDLTLSGDLHGAGSSARAAFGQLGDAQGYSVMASVSLQWDLGGAARAAAGAARAHRTRTDAERVDLEHQLAASAISAVRQLRLATQRIEVTELAVQVADEALRAELVAFQGGRSTNALVFQRQDDVAETKLRRARARVDASQATALLQYLTGGLLARYGVKVADLRRVS